MKKYLILINCYFVRNIEIYNPINSDNLIFNTESEQFFNAFQKDGNWKHCRKDLYLGIHEWNDDLDLLKDYVSNKYNIPKQILEIHEI